MAISKTSVNSNANSERTYHDTSSPYTLPNDNIEHVRLEKQSNLIRELMQGRLIHAPLETDCVHKVLDIGCGTGIVTHKLALEFPRAQVYGVDLSPVPNVREKLPNIAYIQGNIHDLADRNAPDVRFQAKSFDFIFSRLLVFGITDWKSYVEQCASLLKPGGWVEMHDLDVTFRQVPSNLTQDQRASIYPHSLTPADLKSASHPADAWAISHWLTTFENLMAEKGLNLKCGAQLASLFTDAGLQDVRIRRYIYPIGSWEGLTDVEKRFARHHYETMGKTLPSMLRSLGAKSNVVSQGEVERAAEEAVIENDKFEEKRHFQWFYVVSGRKAE